MKNFREEVKIALVKKRMTQRDLAALVSKDLGITAYPQYVNAVITGTRASAPVRASIAKILGLEDQP